MELSVISEWWHSNVLNNYEVYNSLSIFLGEISLIWTIVSIVVSIASLFWVPANKKTIKNGIIIAIVVLAIITVFCLINLTTKHFLRPSIDSSFLGTDIYFGQSTNNLPDGKGCIFDEDKYIVYKGTFKQGKYESEGILYQTYKEIPYVKYDGSWRNGQYDKSGILYAFYNGEPIFKDDERCFEYNGDFLLGERNGQGVLREFDYDNGTIYIKSEYKGSFAYNKKCGYGTYIEYNVSGEPISQYRGTWWEDVFWGKGIWEFVDKKDYKKVIYHGQFRNRELATEGCYYIAGNLEPQMQGVIDKNGKFDGTDISDKYPHPDRNDSIWW